MITKHSATCELTHFVGDAGQEFTEQEWYEFCEARLRLISPYFKDNTMSNLGQAPCIKVGNHLSELGSFTKVQVGEDLTGAVQVQGIFALGRTLKDSEARFADGHSWIYGVERRAATWVLCKVHFRGSEGHKGRGQQYPKEIAELSHVSLVEMCQTAGVHPKQVFEMLGIEVERWYGAVTRRYNEIMSLAQVINAQDVVLMARMSEVDQEGIAEL